MTSVWLPQKSEKVFYSLVTKISNSVFVPAQNLLFLPQCWAVVAFAKSVEWCRVEGEGREVGSFAWRGVSGGAQLLCSRTGLCECSETCITGCSVAPFIMQPWLICQRGQTCDFYRLLEGSAFNLFALDNLCCIPFQKLLSGSCADHAMQPNIHLIAIPQHSRVNN